MHLTCHNYDCFTRSLTFVAMNKKCCVLKCHNVGRHRFPKNEILRRKWIVAIKRRKYQPSWKPHSGSRICRNHFKKSDFVKTKKDGEFSLS